MNGNLENEVGNLLLNLQAGLFPEDLTEDEQNLLSEALGENWFSELGYTEPKYKKPKAK